MLQAGIVGLPNVGKSTLFNALTQNNSAEAANFPFCTIEPNIGIVNVPDKRLDKLREIFNSQKIIPAAFKFVDIAGLVKGASEGAGLGNKFLSHIREVDSIVHVIRCFEDENIHHVDGSVNAVRDFETIRLELALADMSVMQKRIDKINKQAKSGDKNYQREFEILNEINNNFENLNIKLPELTAEDKALIAHLNLLSFKPFIIAANLKEEELAKPLENPQYLALSKYIDKNIELIAISAQIEAELIELSEEETAEYLQSLGVNESGVKSLIQASFKALGLMTYFTAGEMEARAWTVPINCKAPQAAGAIHTDFERGFIKAEVVGWDDLLNYGTKQLAKDAGKVRLEGKEYTVQSSDIIEFKFNV